MKKFFKILLYFILTIFLIVIFLFLIAEYAEDKVAKIALKEVSESIHAPITIDHVSFSLLHNFPYATVEFKNIRMGSNTDSLRSGDEIPETLFNISKIYISVKTMPLLKNKFEVYEVEIEEGIVNYIVDANGISNFDFLIDTTQTEPDTTTSNVSLNLKQFNMSNMRCLYSDSSIKTKANIFIPELEVDDLVIDSTISCSAEGSIILTECDIDSTNLYLMGKTQIDFETDYSDDIVNINKTDILTDNAKIGIKGMVSFKNELFTDLQIESEKISIEDFIKYVPTSLLDEYGLKYISGDINLAASVSGVINDSIQPKVDMELGMVNGTLVMNDYPAIKNISFDGFITNGDQCNNQTTKLDLNQLHIETIRSKADAVVSIVNIDHPEYAVKLVSNIDLQELKPFITDNTLKDLKGGIQVKLSTKGKLQDSIDDRFIQMILRNSHGSVDFKNVNFESDSLPSLRSFNGTISYIPDNIQIKNLSVEVPSYHLNIKQFDCNTDFKGLPTKPESLQLSINQFNLSTDSCLIQTEGVIKNLSHPYYALKGHLKLDLNEIQPMLPDSMVNQIKGKIIADFDSYAQLNLDSISDQINQIVFEQSQFDVTLEDVSVEMPDTLMNVSKLNGNFTMKNDTIKVRKLVGEVSNIEIQSDSMSITKFYNSFLLNRNDTIQYRGNINIGDLDYNLLGAFMDGNPDTIANSVQLKESPKPTSNYHFDAKGKIKVNSLKYNKAEFRNINGKFHLSDNYYIIDQLKLDAFKGNTNSSVNIELLKNDGMKIYFKSSASNIDINQVLTDFDDFKEFGNDDYITHEQLNGTFSTNNLNGYFLYRDSLITDSILMSADLKLENGRLINYSIAKEMGKDYGVDGLDDIQFQTINTKMFVLRNAVYAPLTDINTNTFDVSLFGKQNFNLDCQYHLRFYLKEILHKGKTDRIEKKQSWNKNKNKEGSTKGLTLIYAIYKVKNGKTVKSTLEGMDSEARKAMKRNINIQEASLKLSFHPLIVSYDTDVKD